MASKLPARTIPDTETKSNSFIVQSVVTREKAESVEQTVRGLVNKLIGHRAEAEQLFGGQADSGEVPTLIAVHENSVETYHALCNIESQLLRLATYFEE